MGGRVGDTIVQGIYGFLRKNRYLTYLVRKLRSFNSPRIGGPSISSDGATTQNMCPPFCGQKKEEEPAFDKVV